MPSRAKVALVSLDEHARRTTAEYLRAAGFDVHELDEIVTPSPFAALIVLTAPDVSTDQLIADVRARLSASRGQRIVVVTSRPGLLRDVANAYPGRLSVLAAPAFGWELVDAIRGTPRA